MLCDTGVNVSPSMDMRIRGGLETTSSGMYSSAVTPPTRSVSLTTTIPRKAISGEMNLPASRGFGMLFGDWNTRFQVPVDPWGVYCQISACRFKSYGSGEPPAQV